MEPGALPFYRSPVFIGALITIGSSLASVVAPKLVTALGLNEPAGVAQATATISSVVTLAAGLFVAYKRKTSPLQPLTLTQKDADEHPLNQVIPPP